MFERIENMKKFDAHESQFWQKLQSPSGIIKEPLSKDLIPMEDVDIAVQANT
jgi:hypothetical protein